MSEFRAATSLPARTVTPVTVSAVVCCYTEQRWDDIVAALESLRKQSVEPYEIVVVVDHSPELLQRLRRQIPSVLALPNTYSQGLSGARNTAIATTSGDVVAFLDDDAVAAPDWLERLACEFADPRVFAVGGRTEPQWATSRPRWFPREFDWVVGCSYEGLPVQRVPVRNVYGGNGAYRRDVLEQVGGFRRELGRLDGRPLGGEETELCIRARARYPTGICLYQPDAVIHHKVPAERGTFTYFRARCFAEGQSKAVLARMAARRHRALTTERAYVRRVLPRGVAAAVGSAVRRPRSGGFGLAMAILAGLLVTVTGYVAGRSRLGWSSLRAAGVPTPRLRGRQWAALLPAAGALGLWAASLGAADLGDMSDTGLVSVLPVTYWAALGVVVVALPLLIHWGRASTGVLAAHTATLVVILHATPALLYESLRYSWAWKHIGIVDYVVRHGTVDPHTEWLAAYHSWPGFFTANAFLTEVTGVGALSYAAWAPVFFQLAFLGPLLLLFRSITGDRRLVWLGIVFFYLGNWVGQDYFAPQAFSYFLYLTVVAVCLRWLVPRGGGRLPARGRLGRWLAGVLHGTPPLRQEVSGRERAGLLAIALLGVATIATSHQLTPLMLVTALAALVLTRATGPWWLPWAALAMVAAWTLFMGMSFLRENLYWIMTSIGQPTDNTLSTFIDLSDAGPGRIAVVYAGRALSAVLWLCAIAGALRRRWRGRREVVPILLALSPLPLLFANNYGGEMLFRVYLFALPFVALLAAALVYTTASTAVSARWAVPPVLLCLLLAAPFALAYYGKERMNHFTPQEVAAARWLYRTAPPGSLLVSASTNLPWAFTHYEDYDYARLEYLDRDDRAEVATHPLRVVTPLMREQGHPYAYFTLTRSQRVASRYAGTFPPGALQRLGAAMHDSPRYRVVYSNSDATIFMLTSDARRAALAELDVPWREISLPPPGARGGEGETGG